MKKIWRPRLHPNSPAIHREGNYFAVNCRNGKREADMVQKALVRTLARARKPQEIVIGEVWKESDHPPEWAGRLRRGTAACVWLDERPRMKDVIAAGNKIIEKRGYRLEKWVRT